jgi:hypothetical protein
VFHGKSMKPTYSISAGVEGVNESRVTKAKDSTRGLVAPCLRITDRCFIRLRPSRKGDGDDATERCARRPLRRRDLQHPCIHSRVPIEVVTAADGFQKTIAFTGGVLFANQPQFETWREIRRRCPCESPGTLRGAGEGPASAAHSSQRQVGCFRGNPAEVPVVDDSKRRRRLASVCVLESQGRTAQDSATRNRAGEGPASWACACETRNVPDGVWERISPLPSWRADSRTGRARQGGYRSAIVMRSVSAGVDQVAVVPIAEW